MKGWRGTAIVGYPSSAIVGRQIFVDDPHKYIVGKDGHPRVWLEDGTHEPWPFAGDGEGFSDLDKIPAWTWTNNVRDLEEDQDVRPVLAALVEGGAAIVGNDGLTERQVCRGHDGRRLIRVARVVDVGRAVEGAGVASRGNVGRRPVSPESVSLHAQGR